MYVTGLPTFQNGNRGLLAFIAQAIDQQLELCEVQRKRLHVLGSHKRSQGLVLGFPFQTLAVLAAKYAGSVHYR